MDPEHAVVGYANVKTFDDLLATNLALYGSRDARPFYKVTQHLPHERAALPDLVRLTREARLFAVNAQPPRRESSIQDGEQVVTRFGSTLSVLCEPERVEELCAFVDGGDVWCIGYDYRTERCFFRGRDPYGSDGNDWGEPKQTADEDHYDDLSGSLRNAINGARVVRWGAKSYPGVAAVVDRTVYVEMWKDFEASRPVVQELLARMGAKGPADETFGA